MIDERRISARGQFEVVNKTRPLDDNKHKNERQHEFDLFCVLCLCTIVTLNSNIRLSESLPTYKVGVLSSVKIQTGELGQQLCALIE